MDDAMEEQKVASKINRGLMGRESHLNEIKTDPQNVSNLEKVLQNHKDRGITNDQLEIVDLLTDDKNILKNNSDRLMDEVKRQIQGGNNDEVVYRILEKLMKDEDLKQKVYKEDQIYRELEK